MQPSPAIAVVNQSTQYKAYSNSALHRKKPKNSNKIKNSFIQSTQLTEETYDNLLEKQPTFQRYPSCGSEDDHSQVRLLNLSPAV